MLSLRKARSEAAEHDDERSKLHIAPHRNEAIDVCRCRLRHLPQPAPTLPPHDIHSKLVHTDVTEVFLVNPDLLIWHINVI